MRKRRCRSDSAPIASRHKNIATVLCYGTLLDRINDNCFHFLSVEGLKFELCAANDTVRRQLSVLAPNTVIEFKEQRVPDTLEGETSLRFTIDSFRVAPPQLLRRRRNREPKSSRDELSQSRTLHE